MLGLAFEAQATSVEGEGQRDREIKYQEMYVNSPGKSVVDKLKGMVGTWFTNPAENQSSQGK